jgi:putative heme iron utilization protein
MPNCHVRGIRLAEGEEPQTVLSSALSWGGVSAMLTKPQVINELSTSASSALELTWCAIT